MRPKQSAISAFAVIGMTSLLLSPQIAMSDGGGNRYKITITNLTSGQPFTRPVLATHSKRTGLFSVAKEASFEIQSIAENGNNDPLLAALRVDVHVHDFVEGTAPLVPGGNPGGMDFESSATYKISSRGNARYLSIASMLICTNDVVPSTKLQSLI